MKPGERETKVQNFMMSQGLISEKSSRLPELDYRMLQIANLKKLADSKKAPAGRYESLASYLTERSAGHEVDAAEIDRRLRTWFEDIINRILQNPSEWDQDRVLNGKALMDYLSGIPAQPQDGGQQR